MDQDKYFRIERRAAALSLCCVPQHRGDPWGAAKVEHTDVEQTEVEHTEVEQTEVEHTGVGTTEAENNGAENNGAGSVGGAADGGRVPPSTFQSGCGS